MTELVSVPFHNQNLVATLSGGIPYVAMKPICENIGLDWASQFSRIKRHPVLQSTVAMITMVAEDGKTREMLMMPIEYLNGWLFGIDSNRVKPEAKNKVIEYQKECFHVLANHFMPNRKDLIPQEKPTLQSKKGCLTLEQQDTIKNIVRSTAESLPKDKRASITIKMWSAIKKKFGCTYKEVPEEEFNNVISLLARLPIEGELLPKAETKQLPPVPTERKDYNTARQLIARLRGYTGFAIPEHMTNQMNNDIDKLDACLTSAWTEMDEALLRISHATSFLQRWQAK